MTDPAPSIAQAWRDYCAKLADAGAVIAVLRMRGIERELHAEGFVLRLRLDEIDAAVADDVCLVLLAAIRHRFEIRTAADLLEGIDEFIETGHCAPLSELPDELAAAGVDTARGNEYTEGHRYCTECIISGEAVDRGALKAALLAMPISSLVIAQTLRSAESKSAM